MHILFSGAQTQTYPLRLQQNLRLWASITPVSGPRFEITVFFKDLMFMYVFLTVRCAPHMGLMAVIRKEAAVVPGTKL